MVLDSRNPPFFTPQRAATMDQRWGPVPMDRVSLGYL